MTDRQLSLRFGTRWLSSLAALAAGAALVSACTSGGGGPGVAPPPLVAGALKLVAFESCDETMAAVKSAAKQAVGPYGFGVGVVAVDRAGGAESAEAAAPPVPDAATGAAPLTADSYAQTPAYSGTNVHEAGVDEPDIVKTDGRRIVTVKGGVLHVVDATSKRVTGRVQIVDPAAHGAPSADLAARFAAVPTDLLLAGDHALVLTQPGFAALPNDLAVSDRSMPAPAVDPNAINGPRMVLVDIGPTQPRILGTYDIDGSLVDARQVGTVARIVVGSAPRLAFPYDEEMSDEERLRHNRDLIDQATPDEWLPRYEVTEGGATSSGRVDCDAVSRPPTYSGAEMLTVITFDLGRETLGNGQPVTIMANGGTVYSTGEHLYIAHDQRWRVTPMGAEAAQEQEPLTEIYQLDTSGTGPPEYVASGAVPGWLINQYAMSEWDGHLRVATTSGEPWGRVDEAPPTESAVYVLKQDRATLRRVGQVGGLGKGEQIYAVRFVGPVGYVVTFRQVDPLYTVDLRDPERPVLAGELKITGYSSYLHPAGDGRLIGIGQEATDQGQVLGLQVSLFDVEDPAEPARIAQRHIEYGSSEAEYDPHAFLYWPQTGLLVVPITTWGPMVAEPAAPVDPTSDPEPMPEPQMPQSAALALVVQSGGFTELGTVTHPLPEGLVGSYYGPVQIQRSLVIGDVLWTLSDAGLKANDLHNLRELAWIPLT